MVETRNSSTRRRTSLSASPNFQNADVSTDSAEETEEGEESERVIPVKVGRLYADSNDVVHKYFPFIISKLSSTMGQLCSMDFSHWLAIVLLAFSCILWLMIHPSHVSVPTRRTFGVLLKKVVDDHPSFTSYDRDQLGAAADRWFDNFSSDPVAVVVFLPRGSAILRDLASATGELLGRRTRVEVCDENTKREQLHGTLDETLKGGSQSSIALESIEKLTWDAPLVLQSFADSDHILTSRPLLWISVTRNDDYTADSRDNCEEAIEKILRDSWQSSGGSGDNVPPVISRAMQFTVCLDWNKLRM